MKKGKQKNMKKSMQKIGSTMRCTGILATLLVLISVTLVGPAFALSATSATRDIGTQTLAPGGSTKVTIIIKNGASQALSLKETVPTGWTLTRITDGADSFKASTNEWLWFNVAAGATKTVTYTLTAPSAAIDGDYSISGDVSNAGGVIAAIGGENKVIIKSPPNKDIWISGVVFNDVNMNRVQNVNEKGLQSWTVSIQKVGNGGFKKTVTTDKNGNYKFANLLSGNYLVSVKYQNGWKHTTPSIRSVYLKTGNKMIIKFGEVKKP